VPIHVIGSAGPIMDRLRAAGFTPGVRPPHRAIGPMHGLASILLDAFGSGEAAPRTLGTP
ncbi:MAG: hypothetical protein OEW19_05025, partial [Acidobacteriota bacterium]|nr:hypothetical protein [Acidobacteriota bacterium]